MDYITYIDSLLSTTYKTYPNLLSRRKDNHVLFLESFKKLYQKDCKVRWFYKEVKMIEAALLSNQTLESIYQRYNWVKVIRHYYPNRFEVVTKLENFKSFVICESQ